MNKFIMQYHAETGNGRELTMSKLEEENRFSNRNYCKWLEEKLENVLNKKYLLSIEATPENIAILDFIL